MKKLGLFLICVIWTTSAFAQSAGQLQTGQVWGNYSGAQAPAGPVTLAPTSVAQYGALGDGSDQTTIINTAMATVPEGGELFFPCGTYALSGSGAQVFLRAKPIYLHAAENCVNLTVDSVGNSTDIFHLTPLSISANPYGWRVSGFKVFSNSGTHARHFINFDTTGTNTGTIYFPQVDHNVVSALNGDAVFLNNALAGVAVSGTGSGSGGVVRLTVSSTAGMITGMKATVYAVGGTTEANGTWTLTVINGTQIDLTGTSYSNAYTSGGFAVAANATGGTVNGVIGPLNSFQNPIAINYGGDSIAVQNNTLAGTGACITGQQIIGAGNFQVFGNNMSCAAGMFVLDGGAAPIISHNEMEQTAPNTESNNCMVDLRGSTRIIDTATVVGNSITSLNNFGGYTNPIPVCVTVANGAQIDFNRLSTTSGITTVTGTSSSSGLIKLAVTSTTGLVTNQEMIVNGVGGTTEANGTWLITVVDGTHVTLQGSTYSNAYTSGGTLSTISISVSGSATNTKIGGHNILLNTGSTISMSATSVFDGGTATAYSYPSVLPGSNGGGVSGGIPYFSINGLMASGTLLAADGVVIGGGNGAGAFTTNVGSNGLVLIGITGAPPVMSTVGGDVSVGTPDPSTNNSTWVVAKTNGTAFGPGATALAGQLPGTATNDNASSGNVGELITSSCPSKNATITVTINSPAVVTYTAHGLLNTNGHLDLCPIVFTNSGGALPTGITSGTNYWTIPSTITTNTFEIADSVAHALSGTAVNTSGSQSGTQTGTFGANLTSLSNLAITAIPLTAGDWDVFGTGQYAGDPTTTITYLQSFISTTAGGVPFTQGGYGVFFGQGSVGLSLLPNNNMGPVRASLSGGQNYFLTSNQNFGTSTAVGYGVIYARRAR